MNYSVAYTNIYGLKEVALFNALDLLDLVQVVYSNPMIKEILYINKVNNETIKVPNSKECHT